MTEPTPPAVLETERLLLRPLTEDDHARLFEIYRNANVNRFIGGPPPPFEEYMERVRAVWPAYYARHGFGLWAAVRKDDGAMMGRIGLLAQEIDGMREVEVGYALAEEFWGRGYATEAARACRDWAFRHLEVPHVISLVAADNAASARVAERNGMTVWKTVEFKGIPGVRVFRITRGEWEALST